MPLTDNDETRMSRHQLAARIEQMEATAHRNSAIGAPADRHRPMEDRRRREKIALYKAELDRRIVDDQRQAERDRAAEQLADTAAAAARSQAGPDARVCDACEGTASVTLANGSAYTARGCGECHGTGLTTPQEQPPVNRPPANGRDFSSYREPDDEVKHAREAETANQYAIRRDAAERRDEIAYAPSERPLTPVIELQPRTATTPPPARSPRARKARHDAEQASQDRAAQVAAARRTTEAERENWTREANARSAQIAADPRNQVPPAAGPDPTPVPIEKCTIAEKCSHTHDDGQQCTKNASNAHWQTGAPLCHEHAREARRLDQGKHPAARPAPTPEPATLHNARITTTLSQAAAAFAPQPRPEHKDLNPLEIEVLELVRTHSSGVVIDAAWKAANILHPWSHR